MYTFNCGFAEYNWLLPMYANLSDIPEDADAYAQLICSNAPVHYALYGDNIPFSGLYDRHLAKIAKDVFRGAYWHREALRKHSSAPMPDKLPPVLPRAGLEWLSHQPSWLGIVDEMTSRKLYVSDSRLLYYLLYQAAEFRINTGRAVLEEIPPSAVIGIPATRHLQFDEGG